MASPARKKATYEDVLRAPEHVVAEVVDGELHLSPRPGTPHAYAASALGGELQGPFGRGRGGPGGWLLLGEPELHLGSEPAIVVPDMAGWRRERLPVLPNTAFLTLAPDWICEILSTRTARLDRTRKLPIYGKEAVRNAWLLDPLARTLEVFRNESGRWVLLSSHGADEKVRAEPFDALELDLALLWDAVEPAPQPG
jgi:Uma2 family endonuclease